VAVVKVKNIISEIGLTAFVGVIAMQGSIGQIRREIKSVLLIFGTLQKEKGNYS
jgi:hypothetical protein